MKSILIYCHWKDKQNLTVYNKSSGGLTLTAFFIVINIQLYNGIKSRYPTARKV